MRLYYEQFNNSPYRINSITSSAMNKQRQNAKSTTILYQTSTREIALVMCVLYISIFDIFETIAANVEIQASSTANGERVNESAKDNEFCADS